MCRSLGDIVHDVRERTVQLRTGESARAVAEEKKPAVKAAKRREMQDDNEHHDRERSHAAEVDARRWHPLEVECDR